MNRRVSVAPVTQRILRPTPRSRTVSTSTVGALAATPNTSGVAQRRHVSFSAKLMSPHPGHLFEDTQPGYRLPRGVTLRQIDQPLLGRAQLFFGAEPVL